MKVLNLAIAVVATAMVVSAQDGAPRRGGRAQGGGGRNNDQRQQRTVERNFRQRPEAGQQRFNRDPRLMLLNLLNDEETVKALKLSAEQKTKLTIELEKLNERQAEVLAAIQELSLEQAALAAKVMTEKNFDSAVLIEQVEKIGGLRTEQAVIQTQKLILLRDTLTIEQIGMAEEVARQSMARMRERQRTQRGGGARGGNAPLPQRPAGWDE